MTWETLWAVGRYDLRLTDREFWGMVPRQFMALLRRNQLDIHRREFGPALICSTIWAVRGKHLSVHSFMPSYEKKVKKQKTDNELMAMCKNINVALGGKPWPSAVSQ